MCRILCLPTAILMLTAVAGPGRSQAEDNKPGERIIKLFADQGWYKNQEGKPQSFTGTLRKVSRGGAFGFGRFNPYRLQMKDGTREVYMGQRLKALDPYVGKQVRLFGKAVDMKVEGQQHREIWPASLVVLTRPDTAGGKPDIGAAIKSLLVGKGDLQDVRLDVRWGGRGYATVYGIGVGIWNQQTQFRLSKQQLLGLLKILDDGKFTLLKSGYGGRPRGRLGGPAIGAPEVLVGNVTLTIGQLTRGSMQRGGGEQSKELATLAGKLLDVCEKAAKNGVTATDLADGLKKIAADKLHPLTLSLLVQRIENEGRGPNGWILRVNGRAAQVQVRSRAGISSPLHLELSDKDLDALCNLLIKNDAAGLPINLYAPDYTDFNVSILRSRKNLQARKFARLTPTTHGEKQKNFNRIYAALDALHQRIVKEGKRRGVGVLQRVSFILQDDARPKTLILKSPADVRKHVDKELRAAARFIDLDKIDFKKHYVVVIASGRTNAFGVRISITKVDVAPDRKSATLHWMYRPYFGGAAPPNRPGNPGIIALIERFDGEIKFQKTVYQWPKGQPLPPSAPPGRGPLRPRLPRRP